MPGRSRFSGESFSLENVHCEKWPSDNVTMIAISAFISGAIAKHTELGNIVNDILRFY